VTSQRMGVGPFGEQRFDGCPDCISHFGVKRAHDGGDPHLVVGRWVHPTSQSGQPDARWMVTNVALHTPWSWAWPPTRAATQEIIVRVQALAYQRVGLNVDHAHPHLLLEPLQPFLPAGR